MNRGIDANFSLALHNRTGKYFLGQAILEDLASEIRDTYYWRIRPDRVPTGLHARLLGQGVVVEQTLHMACGLGRLPGFRTERPILHLDPATTCYSDLRPDDIVLCHDLGPLTHPELFTPFVVRLYQHVYRYVTSRCPRMVFVSEASMASFCAITGGVPSMQVIYPPVRVEGLQGGSIPVGDVTTPFLLTVGSIGKRKNQLAAIAAFARSGLFERGFRYVICGAREPGAEKIDRLAAEVEGVVLLRYVTESELNWLYANASGFVLVSLLEGFGLPVAEAVVNGLVPLLSRDSVLGEVAGDAALYCDPKSEAEIADQMVMLATMERDERRTRLDRLSTSIARFSRTAFAEQWRGLVTEASADPNRTDSLRLERRG